MVLRAAKKIQSESIQQDGEVAGAGAYWNHGQQTQCAHADYGEVVGIAVGDQQKLAAGIEPASSRLVAHGNGRSGNARSDGDG